MYDAGRRRLAERLRALIEGALTPRDALADAASGQPIEFDPSLDGGTLELTIVGQEHSILPGEVMGIRIEPSEIMRRKEARDGADVPHLRATCQKTTYRW
jgi:hypothetical protein